MLGDYRRPPAETPLGLLLGRLGLENDFWSIEQMRPRVTTIGYASARKVLGPVLDRDASSAYRWTDMGEVFTAAADLPKAEYCYRMAAQLAPHDPEILSAIGAFYATEGNTEASVAALSAILRLPGASSDPILKHNVFVYYERLGIRSKGLLSQALPDAPSARDYLRYLMRESPNTPAAEQVWRWILSRSFEDEPLTIDYVNFLFAKKQFDAAQDAWLSQFSSRGDGYSRRSPVFNGGFEYEWTAGLPDWRFDALNGVNARRDRGSTFDGQYSLRIDFTGNDNPDFHNVQESVFVQPGLYRLEGHIRTREITSEQGVRLRVVSATDGRVLAETEDLTGTNDWKRLDTVVQIPPGVRVVTLQVARRRSIRIDNQLTGTAWVDSVKLTRVE